MLRSPSKNDEFIVQGQTLKKKGEEKKGEQKKTKKAKLDTTKNQQQLSLTSQPVQITQYYYYYYSRNQNKVIQKVQQKSEQNRSRRSIT